jgi:Fic family protein
MIEYSDILTKWKSFSIDTVDKLDTYLENFRVLFAYNSGKIENDAITYYDTKDVFDNDNISVFSGNPRTLFEIQNQKVCYEYLKKKIIDREAISKELILEVHSILTAGSYDAHRFITQGERPGEFKKHHYVVGKRNIGSPASTVEDEIDELVDEILGADSKDVLTVGTYFHLVFETIHPFADGNGRVGRTMLNYYLLTHDYPPVVIYEENRRTYYDMFEAYHEYEDIQRMQDFLKVQTIKTWNHLLLKKIGGSKKLKEIKAK